jgi:SAM-dependent methyltransferase
MARLVVPAYLATTTSQGGSGHSGTADDCDYTRSVVADVITRSGTFLDVGCANGLLMESIVSWADARDLAIEPYGLDIAPELVHLARARYPAWSGHIYLGNALSWMPPQRFDIVRTGLEYVLQPRRPEPVRHLLADVVAPGGRLVIGKFNEETTERALENEVASWGFAIAGRAERPYRCEPRLSYRAFWIDAPVG